MGDRTKDSIILKTVYSMIYSQDREKGDYTGEINLCNLMRHGHGVMKWDNGFEYKGEWKDSKMNEKGILRTPDVAKYEGERRNGKKYGTMILWFTNSWDED